MSTSLWQSANLRPAPIPRPRPLDYLDFLEKKFFPNGPFQGAAQCARGWRGCGHLAPPGLWLHIRRGTCPPANLTFPGLSLSWPTCRPSDMLSAVNEGVVVCSQVLLEVKLFKKCSKQPAQSAHVSSTLRAPLSAEAGPRPRARALSSCHLPLRQPHLPTRVPFRSPC